MSWTAGDPDPEQCPGMAGDRAYRYAARLQRAGAAGAGSLQARSDGQIFVFRGRRGGLLKVLWHDGQGLCLFSKRLDRGKFLWPSIAGGTVSITPAQLGYLLEGIDWRAPQRTWRPLAAG